jgi:hypothetical protein
MSRNTGSDPTINFHTCDNCFFDRFSSCQVVTSDKYSGTGTYFPLNAFHSKIQCCGSGMFYIGSQIRTFFYSGSRILHKKRDEKQNYLFFLFLMVPGASFKVNKIIYPGFRGVKKHLITDSDSQHC